MTSYVVAHLPAMPDAMLAKLVRELEGSGLEGKGLCGMDEYAAALRGEVARRAS